MLTLRRTIPIMPNKIIQSALGAIVTIGLSSTVLAAEPNNATQKKTRDMLNQAMPNGFEKCYGIAKAGKNDCATDTQTCASQSKADSAKDAWVGVPVGTCDRIVGGSTTPPGSILLMQQQYSLSGVGLGLRSCHYLHIQKQKPNVPWFEIFDG